MKEKLLNIDEIKLKLGIKKNNTIYKYLKLGMPSYLIANRRMFLYSEVLKWFKEQQNEVQM